jgi:hypothetical protein
MKTKEGFSKLNKINRELLSSYVLMGLFLFCRSFMSMWIAKADYFVNQRAMEKLN